MPDRQIAPFFTAVDRLYAAALNPAEWQAFLAAGAALFDADDAYVSQIEDDQRVLDYVALKQLNWDAASFYRYTAFNDEDPRIPPLRRGPPQPQQCRMAVAGPRLQASSTCAEAVKPADIEYTLMVGVPERDRVTNYLGLTRDLSGKPFTAADREALQDLVPHLERAFTVRRGLLQQFDGATRFSVVSNPAQARGTTSPESIIRSRFGLSPRQAVLTGLLFSGRSVKEAAAALGLTEGTARQYLKLIFRKTGARRQVDLIRVVAEALAPQA